MKQTRKLNKKSIKLLILILGLIVLVVSTSYAVFSIRHENSSNQIISAGELELTNNPCTTMTTEMVPMSNIDGMNQPGCNVTIENTGTLDAIYKVLIYNNSNGSNHLSHDNLYISIDNSTPVLLSTITKVENTEKYNLKEAILLVSSTRSHNIKIWIKEDATTDIIGKSVSLTVDIEAVVLENIPQTYEYAYTGAVQEFAAPQTGYYQIELWGASGGDTSEGYIGGKGGYSIGTIYLTKNEILYIYVGEKGSTATTSAVAGKFNGGGANYSQVFSGCTDYYGTGGGATDIRLGSGTWSDSTSLRSRIMVAGGGGGSAFRYCNASNYGKDNGGAGGMLVGLSATGTTPFARVWATGGTQTAGGIGGNINSEPGATNGSFGTGASSITAAGQASGGGGYYGGGLGIFSGGAGGSSYISGYAGVNSVQQTVGTTAQPLHTNNTIHYSGKYFINGKMEAGINTGHGKAKIEYVGSTLPTRNTNYNNIRYLKACQKSAPDSTYSWVELQAISNGENVARKTGVTVTLSPHYAPYFGTYERLFDGITDSAVYVANSGTGTPNSTEQCLTVDLKQAYNLDEVALWNYWADARQYYGVTIAISKDSSTWVKLYDYNVSGRYTETSEGKRYSAWD